MLLFIVLLCLSSEALIKCAAESKWCYTGCVDSPSHWGDLAGSFCGKNRQSPIDIVTSHVEVDHNLGHFTFVNLHSSSAVQSIVNNGHTVKFKLAENLVEVSGGGLSGTYSAIQFHFHWGDTEHHPGSEHTVDGHRYPMEMHIVTLKKGLSVEQALNDSSGIAALGFFLDEREDGDTSGPWSKLVSHLASATAADTKFNSSFSIGDLIGNIDTTKFYRYMGSLTTPNCNEAVVWTVFQQPIKINKNLIQQFPSTGLTNVFRPTQNLDARKVSASPGTPLPPSHPWCYDDHCENSPSHWHLLSNSHCGGDRQSPVNIETKSVVRDEHLTAFHFTKFDDKHALERVINTGHTVKCVLKQDTVEVSGGGLGHVYSTLQFHFHWGSASQDSEGSEHTVDSHRYPMEMHIVNKQKDLDLTDAVKTPDGLAVLAFMIEAADMSKSGSGDSGHHETDSTPSPTTDMDAWKKLTKYLGSIPNTDSDVEVTEEISIDGLLGNVNRAAYYRYNGSLTTPSCNEAVVWTVFKEPIKVDKNLIMMFPTTAGYGNVFRPVQPRNDRIIYTSASSGHVCHVSMTLFLLLGCLPFFFI